MTDIETPTGPEPSEGYWYASPYPDLPRTDPEIIQLYWKHDRWMYKFCGASYIFKDDVVNAGWTLICKVPSVDELRQQQQEIDRLRAEVVRLRGE